MRTGTEPETPYDPGILYRNLQIGVYRLAFETLHDCMPPDVSGSAWRGVLGWALQDRFCPREDRSCSGCEHGPDCAYSLLYATSGATQGFSDPPRPFILRPLPSQRGLLLLEMTLIGPACACQEQVLVALRAAGEAGLGQGRERTPCMLLAVDQLLPQGQWQNIFMLGRRTDLQPPGFALCSYLDQYHPPPPWKVVVLSPLRLRKQDGYLNSLDWGFAFTTLGLRIDLLHVLSGGLRRTVEAWGELKPFLQHPGRINAETAWKDWHRKSSTQRKLVPMGGLTGSAMVMPPSGREQVWARWWKTAELLHLGKGTVMGNGKIVFARDDNYNTSASVERMEGMS